MTIEEKTLPQFVRNFRRRVQDGWDAFKLGERELCRFLDLKKKLEEEVGALESGDPQGEAALILAQSANEQIEIELNARCEEILGLVFQELAFKVQNGEGGYELLLSPEGKRARLIEQLYFISRMPERLKQRWKVSILLEPTRITEEAADPNLELSAESIAKWPDAEEFFRRSHLKYEAEPLEDPDEDWRLDTYAGLSYCPALVEEYIRDRYETVDLFYDDGAAAGFIAFPTDELEEDGEQAVMDYFTGLMQYLQTHAGPEAFTSLGYAYGIYCIYLDLVAWDLEAVLDAAVEYFEAHPLAWGMFHTFYRDGDVVVLQEREDE